MLEKIMNFVVRYDSHKYSVSIGLLVILIISVLWAGNFVKDWGHWSPIWIGIPLWVTAILVLWLFFFCCDFLFMRLAIPKPVRSGIWLSAITGSTMAIASLKNLEHANTQLEIAGQFLGLICAICAFFIGYFMDRKKQRSSEETKVDKDVL